MTGFQDLDGYLDLHGRAVDGALARALTELSAHLPSDVADAVDHGVTSGGKRLRPILCVSAFEGCGGEVDERVYDLGASLEMIHGYSLMHDDLPSMDDARLRRGLTTTHVEHGEDLTVRAGATLIPAAARQALLASRALGCDEGRARRVVAVLLRGAGAGGMVGGQWLDLLGEERALTPEELEDLHRRKTGALLTASVVMGGLVAGATGPVEGALEAYGRSIGLAFQIADDILDATQTSQTLGKNPSDVALDKSTYVSAHGLDEARARAREQVAGAVASLERAGIVAPALVALARYVIERRK